MLDERRNSMADDEDTLPARFYQHYGNLSPTMRKVTQFVMRHPDRAATMSAIEIAHETGTSDATVIRMAQALGFSSLKDMRVFALKMLKDRSDPGRQLANRLDSVGPEGSVLSTVAADASANLQVLAELEDTDAWQSALDAADCAADIWCFGVPPAGFLGLHLATLLTRMGRRARSSTATGIGLADELLQVSGSTAVIIFAPVRIFREHSVVLERAHEVGATSILLTEAVSAPPADAADILLPLPSASLDATGELLMPAAVCQALALALAGRQDTRAHQAMDELNTLRVELGKETEQSDLELPAFGRDLD